MPEKDRNPKLSPLPSSLEDWLQLPDSTASDEDSEESPARSNDTDDRAAPGEPQEVAAADTEHDAVRPETLSLFPEVERRSAYDGDERPEREPDRKSSAMGAFEEARSPRSETELEGDPDETGGGEAEDDEIARLGGVLSTEFGDTLTGVNALALVMGVLFLILAVVGWFLDPVLNFLGAGPLAVQTRAVPLITAAVLALAGLHLVFYWAVHRVSNLVKSREMDGLIELRRVKKPCAYLDCGERAKDETPNPGDEGVAEMKTDSEDLPAGDADIGADDVDSPEHDFAWRCSLFELELEELPLCAVCDRYEPRTDPSGIIVS